MKIKPLRDRILILKDKSEQTVGSEGILVRPEILEEKSRFGTVLAVGPGYTNLHGKFMETTLKPGQRVMFEKHCGVSTETLQPNTFLLPEPEVIAVVEEDV